MAAIMKLGFEQDRENTKVNVKNFRGFFILGTDPSPLAQDEVWLQDLRCKVFVPCLNREISVFS